MQKKNNIFKALLRIIKKIFHSRNIIIISDHKVEHLPISGQMQILIIVAVLGLFSGMSYITGGYIAARSAIHEKEEKIVASNIEKERINEDMELLKRDLIALNQNGSELNSYSKFIIGQHAEAATSYGTNNHDMGVSAALLGGHDSSKLLERVAFLENRINEIKGDNIKLLTAIRQKTDKKINYLKDVIDLTGIDVGSLEEAVLEEKKAKTKEMKNTTVEKDDTKEENDHQGGPFVPLDNNEFSAVEQRILNDVDRMMVLHEIVKQLPLSEPMNEYQQMSPFGKRLDPFNRRWSMHPGLDLAGASGSKISATNDGVVIQAGRRAAYGNMVDIEHKFGIVTRYAHLSKISVKEGDKIKKGQVIGIQGSTGRSTGEHLHYEVRIEDRPVNPIKFLKAGKYVLEE